MIKRQEPTVRAFTAVDGEVHSFAGRLDENGDFVWFDEQGAPHRIERTSVRAFEDIK